MSLMLNGVCFDEYDMSSIPCLRSLGVGFQTTDLMSVMDLQRLCRPNVKPLCEGYELRTKGFTCFLNRTFSFLSLFQLTYASALFISIFALHCICTNVIYQSVIFCYGCRIYIVDDKNCFFKL